MSDSKAATLDGCFISGIFSDEHGDKLWIPAFVEIIRRQHASGKRNASPCLPRPPGLLWSGAL
jgi:hypothetical protein